NPARASRTRLSGVEEPFRLPFLVWTLPVGVLMGAPAVVVISQFAQPHPRRSGAARSVALGMTLPGLTASRIRAAAARHDPSVLMGDQDIRVDDADAPRGRPADKPEDLLGIRRPV